MSGTFARSVFVLAAIGAAIVLVLPATAAAPVVTPTLTPLIGTSPTGVAQVTVGQTAAWRISVTNGGGNTVNHVTLIDTVSSGSFLSSDNPACTGSGSTVTCALGQMAPGATFSARLAFTATSDPSVTSVTNTLNGTFDPQTPNSTNQRETDTLPTQTSTANLVAASDSTVSTYGLPSVDNGVVKTSSLNATHKQFTEIDLPPSLLNGFGTPVELRELAGGPCSVCIPFQSLITIPDSVPATSPTNPFAQGSQLAPYTWSITVDGSLVPPGFKPKFVYHDGVALPLCNATPLSTSAPICVLTLSQDNKTKTVFATGRGLTNGAYQFG